MSTYIPFDLQVPIIERLPVKSLIRFKSVCKRWNSLIDSSHFIAGYKGDGANNPHHLFIRYEIGDWKQKEVKYVSIVDDDTFPQQKTVPIVPPILKLLNRSSIIDSSQGLLCFHGLFRESNNSQTDMVVLWNPSIRKSISVVAPNVLSSPFANVVGFGVCPQTNDPKIVNIRYINSLQSIEIESIDCIPNQVQVFTLSSGKWKNSCSNLPRKSIEFTWSQTVIGQFIYWLTNDEKDDRYTVHNLIMSFDLSTDEFREIEVPEQLYNADVSISRLRESLVLLDYSIERVTNEVCDVWMMMDYGDSKTFTNLFTIKGLDGALTLGFRKTGEPIIEMQDDIEKRYPLVVYDPCLENMKDFGICRSNSFSISSYTESLLLLDHGDGRIIR